MSSGKGEAVENRVRVMVVDDEPEGLELFKMFLEAAGKYRVMAFTRPQKALEFLKATEHDLPAIIISDIAMPLMDGYAFGAEVRKDHRLCHVPFIYLSAKTEIDNKLKARDVTPHFFPKEGDRRELLSIMQSVLNEHRVQSGVNPLTGLPGNSSIERMVDEAIQHRKHYAIFYIDCDNFKAYNDVFGTYAGDRVIREVARAIDRALRAAAEGAHFLGHVGGDDFVAVTWGGLEPRRLCERIFEEINEARTVIYSGADIERGYFEGKNRKGGLEKFGLLSVSIGVLDSSVKKLSSWAEASNFLCEVKRKAKATKGNSYCIDNRKTSPSA